MLSVVIIFGISSFDIKSGSLLCKRAKNDAALCRLFPENERNSLEEENSKLRSELQKLKTVW